MDIVQTFYDSLSSHYDKLFLDWKETTKEQAVILDKIFREYGYDTDASVLDCACGIGTQAIGIVSLGYSVTASDISKKEIEQAKKRAEDSNVNIRFEYADFCNLSEKFSEKFDIVIAMDNALPHMLTESGLRSAVRSITDRIATGGIFVASIRDYDEILRTKPSYSPPYIHKTDKGQRVSFQTWDWNEDIYSLTQYIIEDEEKICTNKFTCKYRAIYREELTQLLSECGCREVIWKFPDETGFYQPIVIAKK